MRQGRRRRLEGSFAKLVQEFAHSTYFSEKFASSTKVVYRRVLSYAELPEALGLVLTRDIRPAIVQKYVDTLSPGVQRTTKIALQSLQKWAIPRDKLYYPITTGVQVAELTGAHEPWSEEEVILGETNASPMFSRIIALAANTGQRGSDIMKMQWSHIEVMYGRPGIWVTQKKTSRRLWVPFTRELRERINGWTRGGLFLVTKPGGLPLRGNQLSNNWEYERDHRPGLEPLKERKRVIHGLRATAVVRLRRAGASTGQIGDFVGMSEPMVKNYLRKSEQVLNALAALDAFERGARNAKD